MVTFNIDAEKNLFTTRNVLDRFNIDEQIINTKDINLKFFFKGYEPYLLVGNKEYSFESRGSLIFFLQKLSLNSTLMGSLSNETLSLVVNERLQDFSTTLNLVIYKNMDTILTVTSMSANLVNWKKILQTVHEVFVPLEEKFLYLTTGTGLGISIVMSNIVVNSNDPAPIDVIRIEPQSPSSISIYRGVAKEDISLRGYDEDEILMILKEKLQLMVEIDGSIWQNHSVVRD